MNGPEKVGKNLKIFESRRFVSGLIRCNSLNAGLAPEEVGEAAFRLTGEFKGIKTDLTPGSPARVRANNERR